MTRPVWDEPALERARIRDRGYECRPSPRSLPEVREGLRQYLHYLQNTGHPALPIAQFDDDHEPIGPLVRRELVEAGAVEVIDGGLMIVWRYL